MGIQEDVQPNYRRLHRGIDALDDNLRCGCTLSTQDDKWWLFDIGGEGVAGGMDTLLELIYQLGD